MPAGNLYIPPSAEVVPVCTERCIAESGVPLSLPDIIRENPEKW